MNTPDQNPKIEGWAASEWSDLTTRLQNHIAQMAPHQKMRSGGELLVMACARISDLESENAMLKASNDLAAEHMARGREFSERLESELDTIKNAEAETITRAQEYFVAHPISDISPEWMRQENRHIGNLLEIIYLLQGRMRIHKEAIATLEARDRTMLGTRNDLQFKLDEVRHCLRNFTSAVQRYVNVAQRPPITHFAQHEYDESCKALFQAMEFAKAYGTSK